MSHNHADEDAGMDGGGQLKGSYLRQFLAILCWLADAVGCAEFKAFQLSDKDKRLW